MSHPSRNTLSIFIIAACLATAGLATAAQAQPGAVGADEIQARLDHSAQQAEADRRSVQDLLEREDVRRIAAAAGLDINRAAAAASVLSGDALASIAAQVRTVPTDLAGGSDSIVMPATTVIIVLLVIILVA